MCGFVAMIGTSGRPVDEATIVRMCRSIQHRGPDEHATFIDGSVGFGFQRLAILDLSPTGHQPMFADDGRMMIVFNGEIYNYIEIREQLIRLGHTFRSSGDTEVLLKAYLQWGQNCLSRLNGMWSFLIYDLDTKMVFGSRDRFGIKPLFLVEVEDRILIASEIKAFLASGLYNPAPNWRLVAEYLYEGRLSEPDEKNETLYAGVREIPAGSAFALDIHGGRFETWKYWQIDSEPPGEAINYYDSFAELFSDSVSLRMRSDVPVGVCLSGGLDSTSIICHMAGADRRSSSRSRLEAFSYMTPEFDESVQINSTIDMTGATLNRLTMTPKQFWDRLPDVIACQDEPVHSMNVAISYELYRMSASKGVKVILNGQGADESLAGYSSYFEQLRYSLLLAGRVSRCWREIQDFSSAHRANSARLMAEAIRYAVQTQFARLAIYRKLSYLRRRQRIRQDGWLLPDFEQFFQPESPGFEDQHLDAVLRNSIARDPLPLYLRVEDRNSMAHSVETRLPFMDYRLISFVFGLPDDLKIRGALNKFILRESMRGRIPEPVRSRVDKLGFPVPQAKWFAGCLRPNLEDFLSSRSLRERGIFDVDRILADVKSMRPRDAELSHRVFRVVQFELLCRLMSREIGVP